MAESGRVPWRGRRAPRVAGDSREGPPVILGQEPFYVFLSAFLGKYPGIQIDLFTTNLFVDLIADNIDVAIRFGELSDSTIIARRIKRSVRYLVDSPDYLKGRTAPSKPEDLTNHRCILLNGRNNEADWHLVSGRKAVKVHVSGPLSSRDFQSVSAFTYKGHGIGLLPSSYCEEQIRRRTLVRLLPGWSSPEIFVPAVYPTRRFVPSKLQMFPGRPKIMEEPAVASIGLTAVGAERLW